MTEDKAQRAREYFLAGANCAQAVLAAFHTECGIDEKTAYRLASGFGAGFARMREVCGAVSGMFLVMNLLRGPDDSADKAAKDAHYARMQVMTEEFRRDAGGSIVCRELLGLTEKKSESPVSEARTPDYYRKRPCVELVALAAKIVSEHLSE